jgi:uncharacterized protein (DUF697 family)/GTP-binding protein EngB required for normal cell division
MRADERIAEVLNDPRDFRAVLLGATDAELASLRQAAGLEAAADLAGIAATTEALIAEQLRNNRRLDASCQLAYWAAQQLGANQEPLSLEEADDEIIRLAKGRMDRLAEGRSLSHKQLQLLQIAIALSELRRKKLRRLRWWRPLLDRLVGSGGTGATAPVKEKRQPPIEPSAREDTGIPNDALWDILQGAGGRIPLSVWEERLSETRKALGRFNIIVAGRTGVGKTTLIGAIFGEDVGNTLMGRPRTRGRIWYPADPGETDVLRLCDTEGLEMERYEETLGGLKREIDSRNASNDAFDHIHVAWLCIDEPSLTVQPGEEALVELLADAGIPVIVVLTKAGMAPAFKETVEQLLPQAKAVVRVRAAPIVIEGQSFPPTGLDELMQETEAAIPNAVEAAWHVASRNLEANLRRCETVVRRAAAAAGAAGAAPIPLADAAGVFGVQVSMIVAVSLNMGVKLRRSDLRAMAVTLLGALGVTAGGRFIAGQVVKLIPGLGSIAGSAITGTTAAALTYGLGRAYLEYLRGFYEKNKRMPNADELASGFRNYWRQRENKYQMPSETPTS